MPDDVPFLNVMPQPGIGQSDANAPGLLVVGGAMRGGTSMLHHLLQSHPQIQLMALELRALRYADHATWAHAAAVHQSSISTFNRIRHRTFRPQVNRYIANILRGHSLQELTTVDRIHRAFSYALGGPETKYVGDKYPDYVLSYPQYIHRPNTKCVFVYRDARDVVASIVERIHNGDWKQQKWATKFNSIEKATTYWLNIMQALHDMRRLDTNAVAVRYEDLVSRPAETIAVIARHLDLPIDGFNARLPTSSSVGRYRGRLNADQIAAIERQAGGMMESWGYTPGEAA